MIEQRLAIELWEKETNKPMGVLDILATCPVAINNLAMMQDDKPQIGKFVNVPLADSPDTPNYKEVPIVYCGKSDIGFSARINLLEEHDYEIQFTSNEKIERDSSRFLTTMKKEERDKKIKLKESALMLDHSEMSYHGVLNFTSYVGKSFLDVTINGKKSKPQPIEVRSRKIGYKEQYPAMISDLTEAASGILFERFAPLYQDYDFSDRVRETPYEDFMLLEYLFRDESLPQAYEYLRRNIYRRLEKKKELVPVEDVTSFRPGDIQEILAHTERLEKISYVPYSWPKVFGGLFPRTMQHEETEDRIDIPENRLVKNLLITLDNIIDNLLSLPNTSFRGYPRDQIVTFQDTLNDYLSDDWLLDVGRLEYIPSNSQVLQKREGYRDLFQYFLNIEFAFRMQWEEMEDIIKGYNRKMSELYEYWCYLKMVKVMSRVTGIVPDYERMFQRSGWNISMRRGNNSTQFFRSNVFGNDISISLRYNPLFSNYNTKDRSYSLPFKPDYSLRIQLEEDPRKYCFVHFDAKYRSKGEIVDFYQDISTADDKMEKYVESRDFEEQIQRVFKEGDIYKMHTYKDAILRSQGAYILYPGERRTVFRVDPEQEIPSVGAFPLTPGKDGLEEYELVDFMKRVLGKIVKDLATQ